MKKQILWTTVIILLLVIIAVVVVTNVQAYDENKILNGKKIGSIANAYVEVNTILARANNNNEICNQANNYVEKLGNNDISFIEDSSIIKYYSNELDSRLETKISNDQAILTLNTNSGELISYVSKKSNFGINTYDKEEVEQKALTIFNNLAIANSSAERINTCIHELGHALGLKHRRESNSVMYRSVMPTITLNEMDKWNQNSVSLTY